MATQDLLLVFSGFLLKRFVFKCPRFESLEVEKEPKAKEGEDGRSLPFRRAQSFLFSFPQHANVTLRPRGTEAPKEIPSTTLDVFTRNAKTK